METLALERRGAVATVYLDRPPVNAVNKTMMRELRSCFDALSQDRELGAVILAARGERAFCAGIDLKERQSPPAEDPGDVRALLDPAWNGGRRSLRSTTVSSR